MSIPTKCLVATLLVLSGSAQAPYLITETRDPTGTSGSGFPLALGYLNHDSTLDAMYVDSGIAYVFLNVGNGRSQSRFFGSPSAFFVNGLALVDVDLDSDVDAVAVSSTADPVVWLNDGNGRFVTGSAASFFPAPGLRGGRIVSGDFNRDGRLDLLVGHPATGQAMLFVHDVSGRYVDVTPSHMPILQSYIYDMACIDLDGDGDLDVVAAVYNGSDIVLMNDGAGRFAVTYLSGRMGFHSSVAFLDLNRDGLQDIFIGGYRTLSHFWLNNGGGSFLDFSHLVSYVTSCGMSAGGDIDGDGWDDLLMVNETSSGRPQLQIHRNVGGQGLSLVPNGVRQPITFSGNRLYLRDMDADGDLDAVTVAGAYLSGSPYWVIPNTTRHAETLPPVQVGSSYTVNLWGYPGQWMLPMISVRGSRLDLGDLGVLGLDPSVAVTLPAQLLTSRSRPLSFPVPQGSAGVRLFTQAFVLDPRLPAWTRLTNWMDDVIVR